MEKPYISAERNLPELTIKAVLLGIVLSVVLAGANAYLGLFAGMTVSASIPAAVISMALLRLFKNSNILENNGVQTAASAGESLSAGVIFTLPALMMMGYWKEFNYWETTLVAGVGGVLGVLFTIPLRSALIVKQKLKFPEGIATSEVLKTGEEGGKGIQFLVFSSLAGAFFKFAEAGMGLWNGILDKAGLFLGGKGYAYFGLNLSPALISVGYIVGLRIAILVFIGGAISWWIAIPAFIALNGPVPDMTAVDMGYFLWSKKIRYLGVGAMVVGGLWALVSLRSAVISAVQQGFYAIKNRKNQEKVSRTEKDLPMGKVLIAINALIIPILYIYFEEIQIFSLSIAMTLIMVVAGFLFSAVAGYMAGIVGSSNNPISGVTIATILFSSLLLLFLGSGSASGPAAAILIGAVVCCAAAIAGDNLQDLKAGNILGATPWKQQIMQIIGVVAGAAVVSPILSLLGTAYGFGAKTPEHPMALAAPQATLMKSVAEGVFGGNLPIDMILIGAGIGVVTILIDLYCEKKNWEFRVPVLAVAVGIYLPFELDSAIALGGILAWLLNQYKEKNAKTAAKKQSGDRAGLLFASGLITGEALVGILLAIPIAVTGKSDLFRVLETPWSATAGLIALALIIGLMWKMTTRVFQK